MIIKKSNFVKLFGQYAPKPKQIIQNKISQPLKYKKGMAKHHTFRYKLYFKFLITCLAFSPNTTHLSIISSLHIG